MKLVNAVLKFRIALWNNIYCNILSHALCAFRRIYHL